MRRLVEGRREQQAPGRHRGGSARARPPPSPAPRARARRRPRSPPRTGRSNRSGIRRSPPSRAACRRRTRPRRYQPPSQASRSSAFCSAAAWSRHFAARAASPRASAIAAKARQGHVRKPGQPDAFALAPFADPVHAVVPVAAADQGKPVGAARQARVEARARNARKTLAVSVRDRRAEEAVMLAFLQRRPFEERDRLIEKRASPVASR